MRRSRERKPEPKPRPAPPREWRYEVVPAGRWLWSIHITHGASIIGEPGWCPMAFGRDRAVRKAERIIRRMKAADDRREALRESHVVR